MPISKSSEAAYRAGYSAGFRAGLGAFWQRLQAGWNAGGVFRSLRQFWNGEAVLWADGDMSEAAPPPAPARPGSERAA